MGEYRLEAFDFLEFGLPGPTKDMSLQWATYIDAANQSARQGRRVLELDLSSPIDRSHITISPADHNLRSSMYVVSVKSPTGKVLNTSKLLHSLQLHLIGVCLWCLFLVC